MLSFKQEHIFTVHKIELLYPDSHSKGCKKSQRTYFQPLCMDRKALNEVFVEQLYRLFEYLGILLSPIENTENML